jgi:hypothetical protein
MDVNVQLHITVALFRGKEPLYTVSRKLDGSQNRSELLGKKK